MTRILRDLMDHTWWPAVRLLLKRGTEASRFFA